MSSGTVQLARPLLGSQGHISISILYQSYPMHCTCTVTAIWTGFSTKTQQLCMLATEICDLEYKQPRLTVEPSLHMLIIKHSCSTCVQSALDSE